MPKGSETSIPGFTARSFEEFVEVFSIEFSFEGLEISLGSLAANIGTIGDGSMTFDRLATFTVSFESFVALVDDKFATFKLIDDRDDFPWLGKDSTETFFLLKMR